MKQMKYTLSLLLFCVVMLNSCELMNQFKFTEDELKTSSSIELVSSLTEVSDYFSNQLEPYKTVEINTYVVEFIEKVPNEKNGVITSTTFTYKVSGTGKTPQLDSFFLEVPACAGTPLSWTPSNASKLETNGIKWNSSISKDGTQNFSITYPGDVSLGIIDAVVTRGSNVGRASVVGPCSGVVSISGSIFIDANENGSKETSESGIKDVSISILDNLTNSIIGTQPTSSNGSYSFKLLKGNYSISVTDELLNKNYEASSSTNINLGEVTADKVGNHFGYKINSEKMVAELNDGTIPKNTEPTKYWIDQFNKAGKRGGDYSVQQLNAFLVNIEGLFLTVPFQFGTDKIKTASNILKNPIKTDLDRFLQQLLTAELNVVSNRGAITVVNGVTVLNEGFNYALLIYSEAVACEELGGCPTNNGRQSFASSRIAADLISGTSVLSAFNGTGGIRR